MGQDTRFWVEAFNEKRDAAIREALRKFVDAYARADKNRPINELHSCYVEACAAIDMRMT